MSNVKLFHRGEQDKRLGSHGGAHFYTSVQKHFGKESVTI